mgnify:FL=1|tara:strand:+ start:190 stop:492 length:303 start_codon:yes stop_codon:yes gene_type:complete
MAFATITFESKSGVVKDAPVGFSWTTLFFWFFPALIRGDWFWAIIIFVASLVTFGVASLVFPFIYNRLYIQSLLKNDYEVRNYSGDKARIEAKAQIKLRK